MKEMAKRQKHNTKPELLWNVLYIAMKTWIVGTFIHNQVIIEQPSNTVSLLNVNNNNICIMFRMVSEIVRDSCKIINYQ